MGFRDHRGRDLVEMQCTEARKDVEVQKADGGLEISPVQMDVRDVLVADELCERGHLAKGLLVLGRVLSQHDLGAELFCSLPRLVERNGFGITNLVLALFPVGVTVPKAVRLSSGGTDFQDEAGDGVVVVVGLVPPFLADSIPDTPASTSEVPAPSSLSAASSFSISQTLLFSIQMLFPVKR